VGGASVIAGQFTATPSTLLASGELDEQDAGLVHTAVLFTDGTYSVASNGRGTVSMVNSSLLHLFDAVFYLTGPNAGFILDAGISANNYIRTGTMQPQTGGPFTSAPNDGAYYGGSFAPATAGPTMNGIAVGVPNIDSQFTLSAGTLTGLNDLSDIDHLANSNPITGPYTFGDSFGRATVSVPASGWGLGTATIYLMSPTQFVLIPVNPSAQNSDLAMFQTQ
jgi:hypothetical protein